MSAAPSSSSSIYKSESILSRHRNLQAESSKTIVQPKTVPLKALLILARGGAMSIALRALISEPLAPRLPPALAWILSWFDGFKDFEEKRVTVMGNGGGFGSGDGYYRECKEERKVAFRRSASRPQKRVDSSEKALVPPRLVRREAANGDHLQGGKASLERSRGCGGGNDDATTTRESGQHQPPDQLAEVAASMATCKDRTNQPRKEPSLYEFKCRVKAFINKFKEDMRLQGQEPDEPIP